MSPLCYHYTNSRFILVADPRLELGTMGYEPIVLPLHQPAIYFELPPRVELGTTDYKSVILPAKLQKRLSYIRQAFYFQFRELVSNLTLLTTVRVPEDITFVLGRGVEPLFPG